MKYKKRLAYRDARIKDWDNNLSKKGGYRKPGSQKK